MNTEREERLVRALERIADYLDPPPEVIEDRQFAASAKVIREDNIRRRELWADYIKRGAPPVFVRSND